MTKSDNCDNCDAEHWEHDIFTVRGGVQGCTSCAIECGKCKDLVIDGIEFSSAHNDHICDDCIAKEKTPS